MYYIKGVTCFISRYDWCLWMNFAGRAMPGGVRTGRWGVGDSDFAELMGADAHGEIRRQAVEDANEVRNHAVDTAFSSLIISPLCS